MMTTDLKPRRICILGYAPSVRFAPWNDPTWELWGLNDQPWTMPRIDVLFEIHKPEVIQAEGHWDRLKQLTIPIFMQDHYPEIPHSIRYPCEQIGEKYTVCGCDKPFITCSASFMLPVALEMPGVTEITLFGVDMAQDTEFGGQRPSCEFFLGVAHGKGIKLTIQKSSDLLKTSYLYGFEDEPISVFKAQTAERRKWLNDNLQIAINEENAAKEKRLQYIGAIADIEHVIKRWS